MQETSERYSKSYNIEGQARLVAFAGLRPLDAPLAPIPEEYQGQIKILAHGLLGLMKPDQRQVVGQRLGIDQPPKTLIEISDEADTNYKTITSRYHDGMARMKKRVWDFMGRYPKPANPNLRNDVMMLSPISPNTISRSLLGNILRAEEVELMPTVPFDFTRLSRDTLQELDSHSRRLGDYRRNNLAFFGIQRDPGLSNETLTELRSEIEHQIW